MAAESNHIPGFDHFEGGANVEQGSKRSDAKSGTTLADFLRRHRQGRFAASGAGDTTVTFTTPFPDANYTISLAGLGLAVPIIKAASTPANTGFIITAAGAGDVHWTAVWDGLAE